ncbi:MAG: hypothetical protein QG577_755, partial [Thermodesulfobacteriota bacterium]|nr:hypothetical protein [Thermodesulfobacteriota bacterium]
MLTGYKSFSILGYFKGAFADRNSTLYRYRSSWLGERLVKRRKEFVMDSDLKKYFDLAMDDRASHAKQINPGSVATAPWVRMKSQFGCPSYAKGYCCPPHTPTAEQTQATLNCYRRAILFHLELLDSPERGKRYREYLKFLVELEGLMFQDGYYKPFIFLAGPCRQCKKCGALEG